ncbi:glucose-6-phosphate isomerase [Sinorhizobium meliloti]|uniref:Glucose-6-phosphate isomerase n=3 Tax=Rhizobium meliloti TaxID=382 RepID=G6PI_RHIME|nr:glucose-6-phosphate isomerase [Sinorhizobium meliloti]Q92SC4.1 RecName: Full=Glucose-6-phosphate isomerase; Short=GPI; AltName: Full=Phosphoglucose isomerase; Short=PGI; AltName: Full=Phosphohexose isomerase; Short=PHI [Sinorhizobium meliloti 1021]PST29556.1 glucose-6-phosphate isomerase [Mesorhizobium loti]TWA85283.1 glucose-6-phosphate isomerase [Ensifer sp. SEMIA 134]TWB21133.1 glucose-6-phosphate isomerase [Ensifer sp. SEMIA 135]AEH77410.1 Glucose-6-phosphate isomerase [Sinorhizobium me
MKALVENLKATARETDATDIRAAFAADPNRFSRFSTAFDDLLFDYSKCAVNDRIIDGLEALAKAAKVEEKRDAMFRGDIINITEERAVLHTALRNRSNRPVLVDGKDVMPDVNAVLEAMGKFADDIRSGALKGATGKKITDVVNIGIGGSDLGPVMATLALAPFHDGPRLHFVSNVDGAHIADTLTLLDPETSLFIVASKTFTTIETMTNAATARAFIAGKLGEAAVGHHFAAVSTALDKVGAFGIDAARVFGFWDWVGGRYSIWSAIGLPLMIAIGKENFGRFLDGGHAIDEHFRSAPLRQNIPMLLGLIGFYNRNVLGYPSRAILPYDQRLTRFPAYLQQLDMESNGKGVTLDSQPVEFSTGPVVWGEPGTNGQHAFYQLIHQGTDVIPAEFMIAANGHEKDLRHQHQLLMANCLAQSEALMKGRTLAEAKAQLTSKGMDDAKADKIAPHRVFTGNRPSLTIVYDQLDPFALGRLIALYEHRVFVEGALFNINSFDQWGVELGKELATGLLPVIEGKESAEGHDSSTAGLVAALLKAAR